MNQTVVDTQIRSSATPRRGPQLPLLQTSVAKKPSQPLQRHRPTPDDCPESTLRSPLLAKETPHVGHRMLRGGLLGFWGKSKVKRSAAGLESPDPKCGTSISKEKVSLGEATLFTVARKSSVAQDPVAVQTESGGQEPPVKRRSQKTTKRRDSFKKDLVQNKSVSWNPPPLFQAYPQAVKHAALAMPPTSADTILRLQSEKKRKDRRKANDMDQADSSNIDNSARHNEDTDASCSGIWLPKVFILATSGYFLQYAGEGKFDRLPEKIMPIGKDSAAFASDAIPGKHWVLQVSHLSDENGTSTPQSHNQIFKNLRFRGEMARRTASNMLLVFENPEDLDSWLVVVRKEIEALGGRKYCREGKDWLPEGSQGLHQRPSVRYLVKRDPNQFSSISKDLGHNVRDGEVNHDSLHLDSVQKPSSGLHESFHSPPVSSTTASTDHNTLERLRLSPRVSYISASAKTFSTSARTSPGVSPIRAEFRLPDLAFSNNEIPMPGSTDFTSARNSFPNETQEKSESRPPTALSQPSPDPLAASKHTLSPGAPNFSIPSFCKRYSSASSTPPLSKRSSFKSTNSRVEASLRIPSVPRAGVTECDTTDETPVCSTAQVPPPLDLESEPTRPSSLNRPAENCVPRRFSSLEYSRGISPVNIFPVNMLSSPSPPHPPPSAALPAVPRLQPSQETVPPAHKLRRPASMQIHSASTALKSRHLPSIPDRTTVEFGSHVHAASTPIPPPSRAPPPLPSSAPSSSQQTKVQNRKSMPQMGQSLHTSLDHSLRIPPVPRLPPIQLSSGSLHNSMEIPWQIDDAKAKPNTENLLIWKDEQASR